MVVACSFTNNSTEQEFTVDDFTQPMYKEFLFSIDSVESKTQPGVFTQGIYKAELCISGRITGEVGIINFGRERIVSGLVEECYRHDHYDDTYTLDIIPKESNVSGELDFKITLFH